LSVEDEDIIVSQNVVISLPVGATSHRRWAEWP